MSDSSTAIDKGGPLNRVLRIFGDVRAGEAGTALLLAANIFIVLVSYYVIKTVREPLILATGGAELKSYASAFQAGVLIFAVPLYSYFASRVAAKKLVFGVTLFFIGCIVLFILGLQAKVPNLGFVFFVWVGIFSVAIIAQFWSLANDIYSVETGERLFPLIAVGATVGAWAGGAIAGELFAAGFRPAQLLQLAAGLLVLHILLYAWILRRRDVHIDEKNDGETEEKARPSLAGGFALVLKSRYLIWFALLIVLLNLVNTSGEYLLSVFATDQADKAFAAAEATGSAAGRDDFVGQYLGAFYGRFFSVVNLIGVALQAFVVSRIVKYIGIAGVLLALPVVALANYGLLAAGAGFVAFRYLKTAENATDYSVMNTAKAMLWLPTSREEKYQAKQAIDTFFVRLGDILAAGVVYLGVEVLAFTPGNFAQVNVVFIAIWFAVAVVLLRYYRRATATNDGTS